MAELAAMLHFVHLYIRGRWRSSKEEEVKRSWALLLQLSQPLFLVGLALGVPSLTLGDSTLHLLSRYGEE